LPQGLDKSPEVWYNIYVTEREGKYMVFLDNEPITLEKLAQIRNNLNYRVYPLEDIVLQSIDEAGNLYFIIRKR
jgi:hypothetical protein